MDVMLRAQDRATWLAVAEAYGVLVRNDGTLRPAAGIATHEIGPHTITPAEIDADGNETAPAVIDQRWHVNMRVAEPALSAIDPETGRPKWEVMLERWRAGAPAPSNKGEDARAVDGVELIEGVKTPENVFV